MLALIFDLDNTIYPVSSISDQLFPPLYQLLEKPEYGLDEKTLDEARREIMRRPFQKVAEELRFPPELVEESLNLLRNITCEFPMACFEDYHEVRNIPARRFLVTTGFTRLQESKVSRLQLRDDFEEIFIVDPDTSNMTKKDVFEEIHSRYDLSYSVMVVVGDDPDSEIKAANELGIKSFLLDRHQAYPGRQCSYRGGRLNELLVFLKAEGLLK
jgi:putative hydrolase of the HAD superfamily